MSLEAPTRATEPPAPPNAEDREVVPRLRMPTGLVDPARGGWTSVKRGAGQDGLSRRTEIAERRDNRNKRPSKAPLVVFCLV